MPLVTENFFPLSPAPPFFFSPLQWCVLLPSQTMAAILKVTKSLLLHLELNFKEQMQRASCRNLACCMRFPPDWGLCWMRTLWRVTESVCLILGWSLEPVTLSAADLLNLKGKKKESLHVLAWSNIASIFLDFTNREISVELYLAMLSSVCNLCSLLCNLLFQAIMS